MRFKLKGSLYKIKFNITILDYLDTKISVSIFLCRKLIEELLRKVSEIIGKIILCLLMKIYVLTRG